MAGDNNGVVHARKAAPLSFPFPLWLKTTGRRAMIRMIVVPVLALALAGPATAQSVVREGRYAMVPVEDGFLRLDTGTDAVSRCTGKISGREGRRR